MKKLLTGFTMLLMALVVLTPIAKAQKAPFTGTVVFDVKVEGDVPEQAKSMMPTEATFKLATDKQSMVMNFGMMEQKSIYDATTQESSSMMNVMGQKFVIKMTAAQVKEQRAKTMEVVGIKPTTDTKVIAGFTCKKAIVTTKVNGADATTEVYYTDDIDMTKFAFANTFPGLTGFPLEYTMSQGPMSFKMVCRSIKKETIPATEFAISSDYKQVTADELRNMFGGGGQ